MYFENYGLKEKPFSLSADPRYLYYSRSHQEALAQMIYAATEDSGFLILTGEIGTGKTIMINTLIDRLPKEYRVAKIYHTAYTEIIQEVNYYCARNGIAMVLRFNGDPVDTGAQPQEILAYINRPVVWHNQGLDITQVVLDSLNRRAGAAPAPNSRPGVGVRPVHRPAPRR